MLLRNKFYLPIFFLLSSINNITLAATTNVAVDQANTWINVGPITTTGDPPSLDLTITNTSTEHFYDFHFRITDPENNRIFTETLFFKYPTYVFGSQSISNDGKSYDFWDGGTGVGLYKVSEDSGAFWHVIMSVATRGNNTFNLQVQGTTSGSPNPVPLPAAVWLFGSGLIGLIGVAKHTGGKEGKRGLRV